MGSLQRGGVSFRECATKRSTGNIKIRLQRWVTVQGSALSSLHSSSLQSRFCLFADAAATSSSTSSSLSSPTSLVTSSSPFSSSSSSLSSSSPSSPTSLVPSPPSSSSHYYENYFPRHDPHSPRLHPSSHHLLHHHHPHIIFP